MRDGASTRDPEQKYLGQVAVKQEEALKPSVCDHVNQSNPKDSPGADLYVNMVSPHSGGQAKRNVLPRKTTPPKANVFS